MMTAVENMPAFENSVGKGENAGNQHFLLFSQYFLMIMYTGSLVVQVICNLSVLKYIVFNKENT